MILDQVLAGQQRLEAGQQRLEAKVDNNHREAMAGQKEVMGQLAQIRLTQDKAIEMLSAQSTMLTTLLLGTQAAPKLVLFLPVAEVTGNGERVSLLKKALSPKEWLNHRVRIFFVDPLTYTVAKTHPNDKGEAEGFELTFPKEWVVKAMPYIMLGLTVLKVAAAAGKLTGFPIPDLGSMIDSQLSALDGFKEVAITSMCGMTGAHVTTVRELLGAVDAKCQELLGEKVQELKLVDGKPLEEDKNLKKCLKMSASELDELLSKEYPDWKKNCGLKLAHHEPSGKSEWVLPEYKEAFEAKGIEWKEFVEKAAAEKAAAEKAAVEKAAAEKAAVEKAAAEKAAAEKAKGMAATEPVHIDGEGAAGGAGGGGTHPGPGKGREAGKARRSPGFLGYFLGR